MRFRLLKQKHVLIVIPQLLEDAGVVLGKNGLSLKGVLGIVQRLFAGDSVTVLFGRCSDAPAVEAALNVVRAMPYLADIQGPENCEDGYFLPRWCLYQLAPDPAKVVSTYLARGVRLRHFATHAGKIGRMAHPLRFLDDVEAGRIRLAGRWAQQQPSKDDLETREDPGELDAGDQEVGPSRLAE